MAPIAQSAEGSALRCGRSEVRIPGWAGDGWVNSEPLEGEAPCNQGPAASGAPRREIPSGPQKDCSESNTNTTNHHIIIWQHCIVVYCMLYPMLNTLQRVLQGVCYIACDFRELNVRHLCYITYNHVLSCYAGNSIRTTEQLRVEQ